MYRNDLFEIKFTAVFLHFKGIGHIYSNIILAKNFA